MRKNKLFKMSALTATLILLAAGTACSEDTGNIELRPAGYKLTAPAYVVPVCDGRDTVELAKIASHLHDIGNLVNRIDHSQSGAVMAFRLLDKMGMEPFDIATVVSAIGNHDEGTGVAVNEVAAALIIADKSDVRRSRVRNNDVRNFDIHDRVNFSVEDSSLSISDNKKYVTLELKIDTSISPIMDYFEIFLGRMLMCRKAAQKLGLEFILRINDQQLI